MRSDKDPFLSRFCHGCLMTRDFLDFEEYIECPVCHRRMDVVEDPPDEG